MRTAFALYFLSLAHGSREMYALLSDMFGSRAFYGTNPFRNLLDGVLCVILGVLLFCIPVVGFFTSPLGAIWVYCWNRGEWDQMKELTAAGRFDWSKGRVKDKVVEDGQKDA